MKKLSKTQYGIIVKLKQGVRISLFFDNYQYPVNGKYKTINKRSVDCLLASKHVTVVNCVVRLTEKGNNHNQN